MFNYSFSLTETLALAICLLLLGIWIKKKVHILEKYFIPAAVIGGVLFSILIFIGRHFSLFTFTFDSTLKNLLMIVFFTTIGFSASLDLLKKGGVGVVLFLGIATLLVVIQNVVGITLAKIFSLNPAIGIATGSVPLTGGHGTSAAFEELLTQAGIENALSISVACATFGLVAGCLIGGPIANLLMHRHNLHATLTNSQKTKVESKNENISQKSLFDAVIFIGLSMGIGHFIPVIAKKYGIVLPAYIGPMLIAAILRNCLDFFKVKFPTDEISTIGNISLALFLSMALMSMKLWELTSLAIPLIIILLVQTVVMALFAYFITFNVMGKDYDAAVIAAGHCGFGLGATPTAMANMETFTLKHGFSPKAFFILPLVGALFIDFTNMLVITSFINFIAKFN